MIDFNEIAINKNTLRHNDKVLVLDICEYEEHDQTVAPYLAIVKRTDNDDLYFEFEDDDSGLYSDHEAYIVIRILD